MVALAALALGVAACGAQSGPNGATASSIASSTAPEAPLPQGHPQVVQPVAGAAAKIDPASAPATAGVSVGPPAASLPQPLSVSDIRRQLAQSGMTASTTQATLTSDGLAVAPIGAPAAVQAVIAAGNEIAHLPYRYGGGHMTFQDTAYDCSGSISYVFAAAHLLDRTVVSGDLEQLGRRPGRASGSRCSPTPGTPSCTSPGCASTPWHWPRRARGGQTVRPTNRISRPSRCATRRASERLRPPSV